MLLLGALLAAWFFAGSWAAGCFGGWPAARLCWVPGTRKGTGKGRQPSYLCFKPDYGLGLGLRIRLFGASETDSGITD